MSINTNNRYGNVGANDGIEIPPSSEDALKPSQPNRSLNVASTEIANVCIMPIKSDAMNAPAKLPIPPTTTTTNTMGPIVNAIEGSVTR